MGNETPSKLPPKSEPEARASANPHPSRNLAPRARGYGIGGGYEKPYRKQPGQADGRNQSYGPVHHSGYYGSAVESGRFELGQAGFNKELTWYTLQYGERTSGQPKKP